MSRPSLHSTDGLGQLADVCWEELMRFLKPNSCIMATRVFSDVLAQLGHHQVEAVGVDAFFYTPAMAAHVREHRCLGLDRACEDVRRADPRARQAVLGNTYGPPGQQKNGHLVALVEQRWLVDLSVSQASHPELGIDLGTTTFIHDLAGASRRWRRQQAGLWGTTDQDVLICYQRADDQSWWRDDPDWLGGSALHEEIAAVSVAKWRGQVVPPYSDRTEVVRRLIGRI